MSPLLLTTTSLGLLKRLPSHRSARVTKVGLGAFRGAFIHRDPAIAVLADEEPAVVVERQPVGANLAAALHAARVAGRRQGPAWLPRPAPAVDDVLRHVREEQVTAVLDPDGTFGPVVAVGENLDGRVGGDERVERRIEALNLQRLHGFGPGRRRRGRRRRLLRDRVNRERGGRHRHGHRYEACHGSPLAPPARPLRAGSSR